MVDLGPTLTAAAGYLLLVGSRVVQRVIAVRYRDVLQGGRQGSRPVGCWVRRLATPSVHPVPCRASVHRLETAWLR